MDYNEFRKNALEQYASLPNETNDLYKKYYTEIALPSEDEMKSAKNPSNKKSVEETVVSVEEKTRLKFDLVFSNSFVRNSSASIKIKKMNEIADKLDNKLYKSSEHKLAAFLNANSIDVIIVDVTDGKKEKLNMLFVNDSPLLFQSFFTIGQDSGLELFQFYVSPQGSSSIVAPLQEFVLQKRANVEFTFLNDGNENSTILHLSKGSIEENSTFRANFVYNGSKISKAVNHFDACGAGSKIEVTELIYGSKEQKFDINTHITNSKERSHTRLSTGSIMDGSSQCQLKGYAKIEKWTKGAFSNVNERGIILSEKAHIDALPDMSIDYSDQVSATHSAATSPIDKEILFYITSRGIEEANARKMFLASFVAKYLSNIQDPPAKEVAYSMMLGRIGGNDYGVLKNTTPRGVWLTASN